MSVLQSLRQGGKSALRPVPMLGSLLLVLAGSMPARAAVPDAPWIVADIGKPGKAGSTSVDANGVWTQAGGGRIRYTWLDGTSSWPKEDRFHFAYQRVKGDPYPWKAGQGGSA